jgi:hypothetical protein
MAHSRLTTLARKIEWQTTVPVASPFLAYSLIMILVLIFGGEG